MRAIHNNQSACFPTKLSVGQLMTVIKRMIDNNKNPKNLKCELKFLRLGILYSSNNFTDKLTNRSERKIYK